jgi:sulfur dioxygenase
MIFRQLFDSVSGTYSYILASRKSGEALIIDPVLDKVDRYVQLLNQLDLRLVKAIDTHLHADHITGLGALRDRTLCIAVMGEQTKADVVSMRVRDGEKVDIDGLSLDVIYTPGHTDDSYSFAMSDRVFTGDTLLIRGTGRTDFQNGDPRAQYESIFNHLLKLPDATLVFPAHDYKGETVSTIGEEKAFNPRLQVESVDEYIELMNNLKLPNPKMMDVAVPANSKIGLSQGEVARKGWAITTADFAKAVDGHDTMIVDIRETAERDEEGVIPDSLHMPYTGVAENLRPGGVLHELGITKRLIFICTFGERSATAVQLAQAVGLKGARHLHGGLAEWHARTLNGQGSVLAESPIKTCDPTWIQARREAERQARRSRY